MTEMFFFFDTSNFLPILKKVRLFLTLGIVLLFDFESDVLSTRYH